MSSGRNRCGVDGCRETKFRWVDGLLVCRNGHVQEGATQQEAAEDGAPILGRRVARRIEDIEEGPTSLVYTGNNASVLLLQCHQLIIWKQVSLLVNTKGFPSELETIVRDLWMLRVQVLQEKLRPADPNESQPQMVSTLREENTAESAPESELSATLPTSLESIVLCYIGILLLRLPLSLGDFRSWVAEDEVIYLRSSRYLPEEMKQHLSPQDLLTFEKNRTLKTGALHRSTFMLCQFYRDAFKIEIPPINWRLLLLKYLAYLALPLSMYITVDRFVKVLEVQFTFDEPKSDRMRRIVWPEVKLMSILIACLKLTHPFEDAGKSVLVCPAGKDRVVRIDWTSWETDYEAYVDATKAKKQEPRLSKSEAHALTEMDIFTMDTGKLDQYMDWYESLCTRETDMPQQLLDMFPTQGPWADPRPAGTETPPQTFVSKGEGQKAAERLKVTLSKLRLAKHASMGRDALDIWLAFPKSYMDEEDLPSTAACVYEAAADLIGCSIDMLLSGVVIVETQYRCYIHDTLKPDQRRKWKPDK